MFSKDCDRIIWMSIEKFKCGMVGWQKREPFIHTTIIGIVSRWFEVRVWKEIDRHL